MPDDHPSLRVEEEKHSIRAAMRRRLAKLGAPARRTDSARIVDRVLALSTWRNARCVLLFAPTVGEPDIDLLWSGGHLADKRCVYPAVTGKNLQLYRIDALQDLRAVPPWNLREPTPARANKASLAEVDLLLVPGLAFDRRGGRLGRGGGFYDRLLAARENGHPPAVGLAFEFQLLDRLPLASHDVLLDAVLLS